MLKRLIMLTFLCLFLTPSIILFGSDWYIKDKTAPTKPPEPTKTIDEILGQLDNYSNNSSSTDTATQAIKDITEQLNPHADIRAGQPKTQQDFQDYLKSIQTEEDKLWTLKFRRNTIYLIYVACIVCGIIELVFLFRVFKDYIKPYCMLWLILGTYGLGYWALMCISADLTFTSIYDNTDSKRVLIVALIVLACRLFLQLKIFPNWRKQTS